MWSSGEVVSRREVLNDGRCWLEVPVRRRPGRRRAARDLHRARRAVHAFRPDRGRPRRGSIPGTARRRGKATALLMLQRPGEAHAIWRLLVRRRSARFAAGTSTSRSRSGERDGLRHAGSRARHLGSARGRLGVEGRRRARASASRRAASPPSRSQRVGRGPPRRRPARRRRALVGRRVGEVDAAGGLGRSHGRSSPVRCQTRRRMCDALQRHVKRRPGSAVQSSRP